MSWARQVAALQNACLAVFREETGTWYGQGQIPTPDVRMIFRDAHETVTAGDGVGVSSVQPRLNVRIAELPAPPKDGDEVEVRGARYRVQEPEPDGEGMVELVLQRIPT